MTSAEYSSNSEFSNYNLLPAVITCSGLAFCAGLAIYGTAQDERSYAAHSETVGETTIEPAEPLHEQSTTDASDIFKAVSFGAVILGGVYWSINNKNGRVKQPLEPLDDLIGSQYIDGQIEVIVDRCKTALSNAKFKDILDNSNLD